MITLWGLLYDVNLGKWNEVFFHTDTARSAYIVGQCAGISRLAITVIFTILQRSPQSRVSVAVAPTAGEQIAIHINDHECSIYTYK